MHLDVLEPAAAKPVNKSKTSALSIFVFIDALGWPIAERHAFGADLLPHRRPLRSVLGYSNTCLPSILTGLAPNEHGRFSFFYYAPGASPLRRWRHLAALPPPFSQWRKLRERVSALQVSLSGWTGYFDIYAIPWHMVDKFDTCEKRSLFTPAGIDGAPTVFTKLHQAGVPYHCSSWRDSEETNLSVARQAVSSRTLRQAFVYLPGLDGLMHQVGPDAPAVGERLAWYREQIEDLVACARRAHDQVNLFVFSDHGMAAVRGHHDIARELAASGLRVGRDYVAFYDSTMARLWFFNDRARRELSQRLAQCSYGRLLDDDELRELGCLFADRRYGDAIFLCNEGELIVPSYMGRKPITGMHGYHPTAQASQATLLANVPVGETRAITDMHRLMLSQAGCA